MYNYKIYELDHQFSLYNLSSYGMKVNFNMLCSSVEGFLDISVVPRLSHQRVRTEVVFVPSFFNRASNQVSLAMVLARALY
uniref:Uncharacterized protein n=1 Tax=Helianthus annuus TaxID=4232 RepID=A0A251RM08_HELAN